MVQEVRYFVSSSFNQRTFDSCRSVVHPSTSGSILSLMCGPWGETLCTPRRWFDFMGSTSNGVSPFDILYEYVDDDDKKDLGGFVPHDPATVPCDQGVEASIQLINSLRASEARLLYSLRAASMNHRLIN